MKKIFLIVLVVFITTASFAQTENKAVRSMTTAEANRLNGTVEPTINGKPYSQYAAEQRALKQQNVNRQITNVPASDPTSSSTTYKSATPVQPQVNQLKGNETAEPASMIKQEPVVVNKAVVETPVVEMGNGNANPASVGLKPQKTVLPAEVKESRTPAEIEAAKKAEALQVQKKPVTEENVTRTKASPMLTGAAEVTTEKNTNTNVADKLKPVEGGGNTPVKKD